MSTYRITFRFDIGRKSAHRILDAQDHAESHGELMPLWLAGKAVERLLRKRYGVKAKLLTWVYTGEPKEPAR